LKFFVFKLIRSNETISNGQSTFGGQHVTLTVYNQQIR